MNAHTTEALKRFIRDVTMTTCHCNLKQRDSGHHIDCPYPDLNETAERLICEINVDETLYK